MKNLGKNDIIYVSNLKNRVIKKLSILIFNEKLYLSSYNHRYALEKCLKDLGIIVDLKDSDLCAELEKHYHMCCITYFEGLEQPLFVIHDEDKYNDTCKNLLMNFIQRGYGSFSFTNAIITVNVSGEYIKVIKRFSR